MKLLYCSVCGDIRKLRYDWTSCYCEKSSGRYLSDGLHAEITGRAIPLAISNPSFFSALDNRPTRSGPGASFVAVVIPTECDTVHLISDVPQPDLDSPHAD